MFFESWTAIGNALLTALIAYAALVLFLRMSGKRTLSKWNAFDLIVTVAFGSSLATVVLSAEVSLSEGIAAFAALVLLQFVVTALSVRSRRVERLVKAQPTLLVYRGTLRDDVMRRTRVTPTEIYAALRDRGIARVEDVGAVILETDGNFSVIQDLPDGPASTLENVVGFASEHRGGLHQA